MIKLIAPVVAPGKKKWEKKKKGSYFTTQVDEGMPMYYPWKDSSTPQPSLSVLTAASQIPQGTDFRHENKQKIFSFSRMGSCKW